MIKNLYKIDKNNNIQSWLFKSSFTPDNYEVPTTWLYRPEGKKQLPKLIYKGHATESELIDLYDLLTTPF